MIKNYCRHEWEKHTNVKAGGIPSTYLCKKCNSIMTAAEVFQLEALENLTGFQRWLSILALVVSIVAVIIAGLNKFSIT